MFCLTNKVNLMLKILEDDLWVVKKEIGVHTCSDFRRCTTKRRMTLVVVYIVRSSQEDSGYDFTKCLINSLMVTKVV